MKSRFGADRREISIYHGPPLWLLSFPMHLPTRIWPSVQQNNCVSTCQVYNHAAEKGSSLSLSPQNEEPYGPSSPCTHRGPYLRPSNCRSSTEYLLPKDKIAKLKPPTTCMTMKKNGKEEGETETAYAEKHLQETSSFFIDREAAVGIDGFLLLLPIPCFPCPQAKFQMVRVD